jgi:Bacterial type II and III secretion system protein
MALQRLSQQTHVPIQLSDKARAAKLRVNGQYNGDLLTILRQLTVAHGVEVRVGMQDKSIHVIHPQDATLQTYPVADYFNPFEHTLADDGSAQVVETYRQLVSTLAAGDVELFNARLAKFKPPTLPGPVTAAYERLNRGASNLNQKLRSFDQETLAIQSGALSNTDLGDREISPAILSKGLLDRNICPGAEVVTEKLFVYFEAPKEIVSFLDGYFKSTPVTPTQQAAAAPPSVQASAPAAGSAAPNKKIKSADSADERCLDEANKTAFKVIEDPTGVIVTGTVSQIELAVRLANDVDVPTKQVLAEVFLVEVQKNWARAIETKISNLSSRGLTSTGAVSTTAVTSLVDATKVASMGGIAGAQGRFLANGGDVNAFITLLESNSVGRSISSPTLIAKNGEEASIEKVVTLREKVTTNNIINPGSGNPVAAPQPQVQKLDVPLKLKIKPTINQHNKHVTMKFEYEETVINAEQAVNSTPIEKGTTKNLIATVLETAPGEVVVLAGLFKEANNKSTSSIPGMSGAGAFATLFGGGDSTSATSTELLVFIKPTVIEPRAVVNKVASSR